MKKIAMIIAFRGYQETEFNVPLKFFKEKDAQVDVYSTKIGAAIGSSGNSFNIEHDLKDLDVNKYNAIIFIGGPGTIIVRNDSNSIKVAKAAYDTGKVVGAICWSPTILAKAGILKSKAATVWRGPDPEYQMLTSEYLESQGAKYTGQDVTIDGKIVTANGPGAAQKYAEAIWSMLTKHV